MIACRCGARGFYAMACADCRLALLATAEGCPAAVAGMQAALAHADSVGNTVREPDVATLAGAQHALF